MKFAVQYPIFSSGYAPAIVDVDGARRVIEAVEMAGFDGIAFTDHPAPSRKWLENGGHETFDPLSALCYAAALTTRVRLLTYLLVLPYRNPFIAAKQVATLDVLSGGRATVAVGTGYLRSEFSALGVEFDDRNVLFDEAVEVLKGVWSGDDFTYEGRRFTASGQCVHPRPLQLPHPPLWVGGNSQLSRRRAATWGQGWAPLLGGEQIARTTRTSALAGPAQLKEAVRELRALTEAAGRDPDALDVAVQTMQSDRLPLGDPTADSAWRERIEQMRDAGVTWLVVEPPNASLNQTLDTLHRVGRDALSQVR